MNREFTVGLFFYAVSIVVLIALTFNVAMFIHSFPEETPARPTREIEAIVFIDSISYYPFYEVMLDSTGQCYMPVNCPTDRKDK